MNRPRVIVVHLRQPKRSNPKENRADPFYEFGSFGCTRCHSKNLMNPRKADKLGGARFAFAQGGPLGFRLVHLTPPARVVMHGDRCELRWSPARPPFRYDAAPLLVDADGGSDFPALVEMISSVLRGSWPARFSSRFRSRRAPLPQSVAAEVARVFDRARSKARPEALAANYLDALPYRPNAPETVAERKARLARLRKQAERGGGERRRC